MDGARYIGWAGSLAVALGVAGVGATPPVVAWAETSSGSDTAKPTSPDSSDQSPSGDGSSTGAASATGPEAPSVSSTGADSEPADSEPTADSEPDDEPGSAGSVAGVGDEVADAEMAGVTSEVADAEMADVGTDEVASGPPADDTSELLLRTLRHPTAARGPVTGTWREAGPRRLRCRVPRSVACRPIRTPLRSWRNRWLRTGRMKTPKRPTLVMGWRPPCRCRFRLPADQHREWRSFRRPCPARPCPALTPRSPRWGWHLICLPAPRAFRHPPRRRWPCWPGAAATPKNRC